MGGIGLYLLAELRHQGPEMLGLFDRVWSPHGLEDGAMRQDAVVVADQQREQLELLRREPDLGVVTMEAAAVVIDGQGADAEDARVGRLRVATRRSATRIRATSSSAPNGLVT